MNKNAEQIRENFLHHLETEKRFSANTVSSYRRDLESLEKYCLDQKITAWRNLKTHHLRTYAAKIFSRGLGPRSIQRRLSGIRSFMNYLLREGLIKSNPASGVKTPKAPKRLPNVLDVDQINQLLNITETSPVSLRDKAILELLYSSGLRLSELVNLNPIDLNLKDKSLMVMGKGGKTRLVPVGQKAIEAVNQWLDVRSQIAKTELSLFGNKTSAKSALIAAQKSVLQMPNQYRNVDQSIQSALLKLDPEGHNNIRSEILISLQNISNSINSLVFNTIDTQQLVEKDNEQQNARSVLENTWQTIVAALKNLVVVRSNNDAQSLKLNATQKQITKTLINLQLEMAKLAILQNNDDEYQVSLNNCIELMETNLRANVPGVKDLIDQLIVLKNFELKQSIPEIDDALALLEETNTS